MKNYDPTLNINDPTLTIQIPTTILCDLVLRSSENGNSIELEVATRLARSLEGNLAMIEEDNALAYQAYAKAQDNPKLLAFLYRDQ